MRHIIVFLCCLWAPSSVFGQISPGILIPDPRDGGSSQTSDEIARPRDLITTPDSDAVDPRINWPNELPDNRLEFDEVSLNTALEMAARDHNRTGNPFTLIVQLQSLPSPAEEQEMRDSGQSLQEVRRNALEAAFSSSEGRRAIYNPNYPLLGEVLSIPADSKELERWIVRISRELPQAKKVRAEQNGYTLQPSQNDSTASAVHSSSIETIRRSDLLGTSLKGVPLCKIGGGRLQVLVDGSDFRPETKLRENSKSDTGLGNRKSRQRPDAVAPTENAVLKEWFVVLRGTNTNQDVEAQIRKLGGVVSSTSSRQIAFRGDADLVEKLRDAGLRPIETP